MWLQLASPPTTVRLNNFRAIERNTLKRVDRDQNYATVGVDTMLGIAVANGMQNCAILLRTTIKITELD